MTTISSTPDLSRQPGASCPKAMVFGPCGGVRPDGSCELDAGLPCPFVELPLAVWPGPVRSAGPISRSPRIMADLRVRPYDADDIRRVVGVIGPAVDAVLVGDHQNRPDFPPAFVSALVRESGGSPWPVLTCRDRSAVALDGELAALAALNVAGVHCVTGDGARSVPGRTPGVFELDSIRLTARAVAFGLTPSVAATPGAPPVELRPARIVEKERAGAGLCIVNHVATHDDLLAFVRAARTAGATLPFIACVPVFTDEGSAAVLANFPGTQLSEANVRAVLSAPDPVEAGIGAAVAMAVRIIAGTEVDGVDLSGSVTSGAEAQSATILRETAVRIREQLDHDR